MMRLQQLHVLLDRAVQAAASDGEGPSQRAGVLVHCVSGRNRSATVLAACLMERCRCSADAALAWLRHCRPIVQPCPHYICELERWQKQQERRPIAPAVSDASIDLLPDGTTLTTNPVDGHLKPTPLPAMEARRPYGLLASKAAGGDGRAIKDDVGMLRALARYAFRSTGRPW